jgi:hypothetical protein
MSQFKLNLRKIKKRRRLRVKSSFSRVLNRSHHNRSATHNWLLCVGILNPWWISYSISWGTRNLLNRYNGNSHSKAFSQLMSNELSSRLSRERRILKISKRMTSDLMVCRVRCSKNWIRNAIRYQRDVRGVQWAHNGCLELTRFMIDTFRYLRRS